MALPHHLSVTDLYRSSCEELGVPLAKHKVASLASCMTVLGIEIDTKASQLCLPGDKQQGLKALLVSWQQCSRWELESLVGLLNHACKVVRPGRSFLHCMIDLLHKADRGMVPRHYHHIRLNESFRSDLWWWLVLLQSMEWGFMLVASSRDTPGGPVRHIGSMGLWCLLAPILVLATLVILVTPPPNRSKGTSPNYHGGSNLGSTMGRTMHPVSL